MSQTKLFNSSGFLNLVGFILAGHEACTVACCRQECAFSTPYTGFCIVYGAKSFRDKPLLNGEVSLDALADAAGDPKPCSGKQEYLENHINSVV